MDNRIQINGVWYVKETQTVKSIPVFYEGCVLENDYFVFDATISSKDFDDIVIEITDKRENPFKVQTIDNSMWLMNVLKKSSVQYDEIKSILGEKNINEFIEFINVLHKKNWF